MNLHIIDIKQQKQMKNMIFFQFTQMSLGDRKSKLSLTEDKKYYEEAHLFTHLFRHTMLYIKSLFGNIFVLVLEIFYLKANCHRGTFMLDKTQISLCIKKLYYYEEKNLYTFINMTIQTK